ncbi:MAG TPA: radical SAM family heme chaperone HemW [Mollicutes bacterium]|nr:radical SAM family heme chaperone HemW [Mollicutes bacterium]
MKAVYIHIPFCSSICNYCDFSKMYYDKKMVNKYLETLEKEIITTYKKEKIKTIYIGGGTPSSLDLDELKKLFKILDIFDKSEIEEYTIECNIDNTNLEKLLLFKEKGINRISFGVQSFNDETLKILGRKHNEKMIKDTISLTKKVGINNINIDLIYGIKNQTLDDLKKDVEKFLKLDVPHISLYSLIIEPHTKLYINNFQSIDEDINANMYNYINKTLKENNYNHYEISNYAKEGYKSKHNLVYWNNMQYYGFGLGASSYVGNVRYDNTRSLTSYLKGNYILNKNVLTERETMENEMILGLRLTSGVNKKGFYKKYNKQVEDVFDIKELLSKKLLIDKNDHYFIPEDKLFISNSILIEFLE